MTKNPDRAGIDQWLSRPVEELAPEPSPQGGKETLMEPLRKLVDGIKKYQQDVFSKKRELFETLKTGQSPLALVIACSDSRVDPCEVTQTQPGELFILRTAGNIVPPYGAVNGGEAGTIEYAISVLKIPHIIVCGHSHCGAMAGLLDPAGLKDLPAVQGLLAHAEATRRIVNENHPDVQDKTKRQELAVETNVLVQMKNLKTHPSVAAAMARGELELHGWVYEFETGRIRAYSPSDRQFAEIGGDADTLIA